MLPVPLIVVAPLFVKAPIPVMVKTTPVFTIMFVIVTAPAWVMVCVAEKVIVPKPVKLTGPVAFVVIPPANMKFELFAEETEVPAPVVNKPVKILDPASLLSVIVAVPESVTAPPAVKFDVLKFNDPD